MRRGWLCVPMISLMLLSGCAGSGVGKAEQQALDIREDYLQMTACTALAQLRADYGQRVYDYRLTLLQEGEETTLTLTEPEEVAGITAHLKDGGSMLEYEELLLDTGPLDEEGLTPVSAIPAMLETARTGYVSTCLAEQDGLLRVDYCDPELAPNRGRAVTLWFYPDTGALARGEICVDGVRVIECIFSNFTMG